MWLEELHDLRVSITLKFQERLDTLRQNLSLLDMGTDIAELESLIQSKIRALATMTDLGSSLSSCDHLLHDIMVLQSEAQELAERCSKAVKASQDHLSAPAMESSVRAYNVLDLSAEYLRQLERRCGHLAQATAFFKAVQAANFELDQLEIQVRNVDPLKNAKNSRSVLEDVNTALEEIINNVSREGNLLLEQVGNRTEGTGGVSQAIEGLIARAGNIRTMSNLKHSQVGKEDKRYDSHM